MAFLDGSMVWQGCNFYVCDCILSEEAQVSESRVQLSTVYNLILKCSLLVGVARHLWGGLIWARIFTLFRDHLFQGRKLLLFAHF